MASKDTQSLVTTFCVTARNKVFSAFVSLVAYQFGHWEQEIMPSLNLSTSSADHRNHENHEVEHSAYLVLVTFTTRPRCQKLLQECTKKLATNHFLQERYAPAF